MPARKIETSDEALECLVADDFIMYAFARILARKKVHV